MFGRKNKPQPKNPADERRSRSGPIVNPAFSYYTSRMPDATARRLEQQRAETSDQPASKRPFSVPGQLSMWLLLALVGLCAIKLLVLGTDPKIIMLGRNDVSSHYIQPANVYEQAAHRLLGSSITNRTKLTVNMDGTAAELQRQYPELQAVSLTLPLIGNRPIVYVEAAQPSIMLQTSSHGTYALNASGLVLARVSSLPSGVPVVVDRTNASPVPGHRYLPGTTISFIKTISQQLAAANIPIATFVLPAGAPYELDVRIEGKPYTVRCNVVADALQQSGAVIGAIRKLGTTVPVEYIDVRVPGRVYYK
jgi:hypothetical protein